MVIKKNIVQISILTTFGCFSWFKFSQPYPCILSLFSSTLFPQGHVLSCALIHVSFNSPCRLVFWVLAVYLVVLLMKRGCGTFRKYGLVEESGSLGLSIWKFYWAPWFLLYSCSWFTVRCATFGMHSCCHAFLLLFILEVMHSTLCLLCQGLEVFERMSHRTNMNSS